MEEKILSGKLLHRIKIIGDPTRKSYITKYVVDLDVRPVITEIRIYADEQGHYAISKEYHSNVIYGEDVRQSLWHYTARVSCQMTG